MTKRTDPDADDGSVICFDEMYTCYSIHLRLRFSRNQRSQFRVRELHHAYASRGEYTGSSKESLQTPTALSGHGQRESRLLVHFHDAQRYTTISGLTDSHPPSPSIYTWSAVYLRSPPHSGSNHPHQASSSRTYTQTIDQDEQGRSRFGRRGSTFGLWAATKICLVSRNETALSACH